VLSALPKPPSSLVATDVGPDNVRLNWNSGNTEPIVSYVVQFRPKYSSASPGGASEPSSESFREVVDIRPTEYRVTGLAPFTVYEMRVAAVNGVGRSAPSGTIDVTTAELGRWCRRLAEGLIDAALRLLE
jgi:hypothetical protein